MQIKDLENGYTWTIGEVGFQHSRFLRFNASRGEWQWTDRVVKAESFGSREQAERHLKDDVGVLKLLALMPEKDRPKVKAVKLELRLG